MDRDLQPKMKGLSLARKHVSVVCRQIPIWGGWEQHLGDSRLLILPTLLERRESHQDRLWKAVRKSRRVRVKWRGDSLGSYLPLQR